MADGAVGFVINKLVSLLTNEAALLGGLHQEIADIKNELECMQSFLRDAGARVEHEDADTGMKTWVKQVRELAYQIEDVIDEYMLLVARREDQQSFLHKATGLLKEIKERYEIGSKIQQLKNAVRETWERSGRYNFSSSAHAGTQSSVRGGTWQDPRVASLFIDEAELVGIEIPRNELVSVLVEGPSKNMVISLVGMGGLGKTTLAKKVFDHERVTEHFDCSAWITVSQSYKTEEVLRAMIKKLQSSRREPPLEGIETMEEQQLISTMREYLSDKRYVVVFDDVWKVDFWGYIKHVLVDKDKGSRIIITTRNEDVAPSFKESSYYLVYKLPPLTQEEALELFHKKVFQCQGGYCPPELLHLSHSIVEKCEGLPLAIVTLGGLLATKDKTLLEWKKVYNGLRSSLASNQYVESAKRILSLSYHDLPYYLKTCFLYLGIFPEDFIFRRGRILRLWAANGFVQKREGIRQEDIADEYLEDLIHRNLVQVARFSVDGKIKECRVHDVIREVILSKSRELGFHHVSIVNRTSLKGIGRHLAIHSGMNNGSESNTTSQTRSILFFCKDKLPKSLTKTFFSDFKILTVLDFEGALLDCIPEELGNLLNLSYLSLMDTKVKTLPRSLGKLRNLETLDLRGCRVIDLPNELSRLHKLSYLMGYSFDYDEKFCFDWARGLKIYGSIASLKNLQKLSNIEVDHNTGLIKDLQMLTELRTLGIQKLTRENGLLLCDALEKMRHLLLLGIYSISEDEFLELHSLSCPPPLLRRLDLRGPLSELPRWISKLKNLVQLRLYWSRVKEDALEVLQGLPNLQNLRIWEGYDGEKLCFKKGCFQKLKELRLWQLVELKMVTIEEGGLPSLEILYLSRLPQLKKLPPGIQSLRNLKDLHFSNMQQELVLGILPDRGQDYWRIKHVPAVFFHYTIKGFRNQTYKLGDLGLLDHLNGKQNSTLHL